VALRLGFLDEAQQSFRATLNIDPKHADARHNLAILEGMGLGREGALSFDAVEGAPSITIGPQVR
jgi:hypothetical protein